MARKRRRRRNPGALATFVHEHPWLTLFGGLWIVGTVAQVIMVTARGYSPEEQAAGDALKKLASPPASS